MPPGRSMKFGLQRREGAESAMFPGPECTSTTSLLVCGSVLSLYTRWERQRRYANKQSSFSSTQVPCFFRGKRHLSVRQSPAIRTSLKRRMAIPGGSLPAGSLTQGEADGVRYSRAGIQIRRPREQPRLATEFVSPVRARGGRLAGLVEPPARNATWANVGGPVANGIAS